MSFQLAKRAASAALILSSIHAFAATPAFAQATVRGILYDDATGGPVRGTVMLVDPATDAAVVHVSCDSLGQFALQVGRGTYQIAAVRPGYTSMLSAAIPLGDGERLTVKVPIAQSGDPQHRIGVIEHVRPQPADARTAEFPGYQTRKLTGTGLHYDRADFEKTSLRTLGEFLETVPGLRVVDPASTSSMNMVRTGASSFSSTSSGITACHVGWFVDGHRMDMPGRADAVTDGLGSMSLDIIEAVEVFRGLSEMPSEFAEPDLRCGAVAIWTKRG